jgi:hypothetical protein
MIIRFLAIVVTGLAVIAPAAHLFELSGKIQMSEQDYFVVQRIYLGWWVVGLFLPAALILNLALVRCQRRSIRFRPRLHRGRADRAQSRDLPGVDPTR